MRWPYLKASLKLCLMALCLLGGVGGLDLAYGGTHGGNGFFTKVNASFDFGLTLPPTWLCEGCDRGRSKFSAVETSTEWLLLAPGNRTSMHIRFSKDVPATNLEELKAKITAASDNHGVRTWYSIDRGGFVGFSSAPQPAGEHANTAIEYYLVTAGRVIRLEWRKNAAEPEEALQLDAIKASINRVSYPPHIDYIRSERAEPYHVGEEACLLIGASDVRGQLSEADLTDVKFDGELEHWRRSSVVWDRVNRRFRVCTKVTSTFDGHGLLPSFTLTSSASSDDDENVGNQVVCRRDAQSTSRVRCESSGGAFGQPQLQTVNAEVALVDHPVAELTGPRLLDVRIDPLLLNLQLVTEVPANMHLAVIQIGKKSQYIYPDELQRLGAVSIADMVHEGWNTIDQITLFDQNGLPTVLRLPSSTDSKLTHGGGETYEIVPWKGPVMPSGIRVKTFLKGGGFR